MRDDTVHGLTSKRSAKAGDPVPKPVTRRVTVTPASKLGGRLSTHWTWTNWLPVGALSLLAGREGIAKSTIACDLGARVTRGTLPGRFFGTPRGVIICATEDSWRRTLIPRLEAHGADLDRIYQVNVETVDGFGGALILPTDLDDLEHVINDNDVALVLLDPLLSRLDEKLNTHVDAEVRQALEPLSALADKTDANVLGIIHVNKSTGRDAGDRVMGSRAFVAVARSVLYVMKTPDDDEVKVLGMIKNNLGKLDVPGLKYRIETKSVGLDEHGDDVPIGHIVWEGATEATIDEMLIESEQTTGQQSKVDAAGAWLTQYLATQPDQQAASVRVKLEGKQLGHSERNLQRAMKKPASGVTSFRGELFPAGTWWALSQLDAGLFGADLGETPGRDSDDKSLESAQLS